MHNIGRGNNDFTQKTKNDLAKRVAYLCCNPVCGKLTIQAKETNDNESILTGEAAHICGASLNAARYNDIDQLPSKTGIKNIRSSIINGIWLCRECAKIIDSEPELYSVKTLLKWKKDKEKEIRDKTNNSNQDIEIIEFITKCLDRPAIRTPMMREGCIENMATALKSVICSLSTGILYDNEKNKIECPHISNLSNQKWAKRLNKIKSNLNALNTIIEERKNEGKLEIIGHSNSAECIYYIYDSDLLDSLNNYRIEILRQLSSIRKDLNLSPILMYKY